MVLKDGIHHLVLTKSKSFQSNQSSLAKTTKSFQAKASRLKKAVEDVVTAIDRFLPQKTPLKGQASLRDKILALKGNFSSTMPILKSYNSNLNDYFAFDHERFLTMLNSLSSINNPNTTVREKYFRF